MGWYINPPNESKEAFLQKHGSLLLPPGEPPLWEDVEPGYLPVCLVMNPLFTAAAVMADEHEMSHWDDPSDKRPKLWFIVPIEDLRPVTRPDLPTTKAVTI